MIRLFLPPEQIVGDTAHIRDNDHLHLTRVLRARSGDSVLLLDGLGNAFQARLVSFEKHETTAQIESSVDMPPEPPIFLTVGQALGKGDKFEQVIQHGTEAGASAFVPVRAERSVVDIPAAKVADRLTRWRQIAKGAAEQSGRSRIAEIAAPQTVQELLRTVPNDTQALMLHTDAAAVRLRVTLEAWKGSDPPGRLLLLVGPEGGWSPAETAQAQAAGAILAGLGPRILRTETAALVAISQILYSMEI
jgi:16S rRNA (uracil1498-N3)-methyltransferase